MVAGQIGTAFAARTERSSLRAVVVTSNRLLLWGIAFELTLAAAIIYLPPLQTLLGTAPLGPDVLLVLASFAVVVWRRRTPALAPAQPPLVVQAG